MEMENIAKIIRAEVNKKGYNLEERKSVSTDSWYFKIYDEKYSLLFRLSDHNTKKDVVTLRVDKKLTQKAVQTFIQNRCNDLSKRRLKGLLGI